MLQLYNIVKTYEIGEMRQDALRGVNVCFRDSEFVSILGQSGSGKTTMLNIIGGLDRYNEGDLIINGVSTKEYSDAQWDSYRNHTIGFVFQSYNLIPHQSVLANVEMALTLAGVSKKERRQRAIDVLIKVGLEEHIYKKPNQMSGGQMQRVAIARALINNPDILLADEPTGALDSETSVQIMELLKEISKDKLVIMVTHNPELAEKYSTRVINLFDGRITNDTDPYLDFVPSPSKNNYSRVSMSFATALALSFNNLKTKKGRTILTAFAGSIGIIGIGLILAISTGMNVYIDDIQKETMSSYPLTITSQAFDSSGFESLGMEMLAQQKAGETAVSTDRTGIYADYTGLEASNMLFTAIKENHLSEFKKYLDNPDSKIHEYLGEKGAVCDYAIKFSVYSKTPSGKFIDSNDGPELEDDSLFGGMLSNPMFSSSMSMFTEMVDGNASNFSELSSGVGDELISDTVTENYDLLYGSWPTDYNQVVLVLDNNNGISLEKMYQLGFIDNSQYNEIASKISNGEAVDELTLDYSKISDHKFYLVAACDHYEKNTDGTFGLIDDLTGQPDKITSKAIELSISGIVRLKPDALEGYILTPVGYTNVLKKKIIDLSAQSEVVTAQLSSEDINVLNNMQFALPDDAAKIAETKEYLKNAGEEEKASVYQMIALLNMSKEKGEEEADAEAQNESKGSFFSAIGDKIKSAVNTVKGMRSAMELMGGAGSQSAGSGMSMNNGYLASLLDDWLENSPDDEVLLMIYDQFITESSYEKNLASFGYVDYNVPTSINLYSDDFEGKDGIAACIEEYNQQASEDNYIYYTDFVAMLTSSLTTIINGVSYVLVAFVTISLFVSCIMIGIITHISVVERTKEIGILRALGASKSNISQVFNAETFIIGCCSGLLGIGVCLGALIPINSIIEKLTGIENLDAQLSVPALVVLVGISICITILGGLIPSKKAANKDPVVALRSE